MHVRAHIPTHTHTHIYICMLAHRFSNNAVCHMILNYILVHHHLEKCEKLGSYNEIITAQHTTTQCCVTQNIP